MNQNLRCLRVNRLTDIFFFFTSIAGSIVTFRLQTPWTTADTDKWPQTHWVLKTQLYCHFQADTRDTSEICCLVAQACPTLCDAVDCSMPVFPVHHHLLEFAQTHVHRVGDAIQPSHPLLSSSPPAFSLQWDLRDTQRATRPDKMLPGLKDPIFRQSHCSCYLLILTLHNAHVKGN